MPASQLLAPIGGDTETQRCAHHLLFGFLPGAQKVIVLVVDLGGTANSESLRISAPKQLCPHTTGDGAVSEQETGCPTIDAVDCSSNFFK